jgi:hypothetical protein
MRVDAPMQNGTRHESFRIDRTLFELASLYIFDSNESVGVSHRLYKYAVQRLNTAKMGSVHNNQCPLSPAPLPKITRDKGESINPMAMQVVKKKRVQNSLQPIVILRGTKHFLQLTQRNQSAFSQHNKDFSFNGFVVFFSKHDRGYMHYFTLMIFSKSLYVVCAVAKSSRGT